MIYLGNYEELYPGMGFPSIKSVLPGKPYPGQKEAIAYMKSVPSLVISTKIFTDIISGDLGDGCISYYDDGVYGWSSELTYYVEKYNLALPKDFIEYAFDKINEIQNK